MKLKVRLRTRFGGRPKDWVQVTLHEQGRAVCISGANKLSQKGTSDESAYELEDATGALRAVFGDEGMVRLKSESKLLH